MSMIHACVDNFDHNTDEPRKLRGAALDKHVLSTATSVSIFWLTETAARASRIDDWTKRGILDLDNSVGYPWLIVKRFDKEKAA
jgi:hypothetical protein